MGLAWEKDETYQQIKGMRNDPDEKVRGAVTQFIQRANRYFDQVSPTKEGTLADLKGEDRQRIADGLSRVQGWEFYFPEFLDEVSALLRHPSASIRIQALRVLGSYNVFDQVMGPLERGLGDKDPAVKRQALKEYSTSNAAVKYELIAPFLGDSSAETRRLVISMLGRCRDYKQLSLQTAIEDPDPDVRLAAVRTAARLRLSSALPQVIAALNDKDQAIRTESVEALSLLGREEHAELVSKVLASDPAIPVRASAAACLGSLGADKYAEDVAELLRSGEDKLVSSAIRSLLAIGKAQHAKLALRHFTSPNPNIARSARNLLRVLEYHPNSAELYDIAAPAVVHLAVKKEGGKGGIGTGFFVDASGQILTSNHVVSGAEAIVVTLKSGKNFEATVKRSDAAVDLALLVPKDGSEKFPYIPLAQDRPHIGDQIMAIGHPRNLKWSLSEGKVSQFRNAPADFNTHEKAIGLIQSDLAANPGNSGCPMINDRAEAVAVLRGKLIESEGLQFGVAACIASRFVSGFKDWPMWFMD